MPYTVKFEVDPHDDGLLKSELEIPQASSELVAPTNAEQQAQLEPSSILASLSASGSTPNSGKTRGSFSLLPTSQISTSELFGDHEKLASGSLGHDPTKHEKALSSLIQPKSRFSSTHLESLVAGSRRKSLDATSLGVRNSRSGSGSGLSVSRSNSTSKSGGFSVRSNSVTNRSRSGSVLSGSPFLHSESHTTKKTSAKGPNSPPLNALVSPNLHKQADRKFSPFHHRNDSSGSFAITEEDENELASLRASKSRTESSSFDPLHVDSIMEISNQTASKLAPYGGFSRSDLDEVMFGDDNIFEHSPWHIVKADGGNGSLVKAVNLARQKGKVDNCRWVGAMSLPSDEIPEHILDDINECLRKEYDSDPVTMDDLTFQGYYKLFCKQILWPTLHYQLPDDPKTKAFEEHSFYYYKKANQMIADQIVKTYKEQCNHDDPKDPDNMIWVHDYHLLLVPQMVREQLPEAKIGFFLHVSFPSSEVFRCLAQRKTLLLGLLGADCITFQTDEYVRHFVQTCNRLLLTDFNDYGVVHGGRLTKVTTSPVGIDAASLSKILSESGVKAWAKSIRERWPRHKIIASRDKLDKLRGVKQKLLAYEQYLKKDNKRVRGTVLLQIFSGSMRDSDYTDEVMQIISRINLLADNISSSQPVFVLQQDIEFDQYLALQLVADVFIVSSMREGLNLTCHEFIVATQQKKSPLLISEFAGSSTLLECGGRGAFLINPWDIGSFARILESAMSLSEEEKAERWKNCYDVVLKHDSLKWVINCIDSVQPSWLYNERKSSANVKPFTLNIFHTFHSNAEDRKVIIISVDDLGAKKGHENSLELSLLASRLLEISSEADTDIYFQSVMNKTEMELTFKDLTKVGLIAEFGAFIRMPASLSWISLVPQDSSQVWKNVLSPLLKLKAERLTGSKAVIDDHIIRLIATSALAENSKKSSDYLDDCVRCIKHTQEDTSELYCTILQNSLVVQPKEISIQAMNLLLSYYSSEVQDEDTFQQLLKKHMATGSLLESTPRLKSAKHLSRFIYAGGLNPMDEAIYDLLNLISADCTNDAMLTVSVEKDMGLESTSARYCVSGQNELFGILSTE